ncbi:hypothetical protein MUK42_36736 [Musa troglodytarum]|uniref:Uncharacterized protein n=1 Tax=Musa troglodytarum TaxID=320322 RepID=A0A9E7FYM0_9LILI|nr:hypothetical protein MUK42_36736 [Musa troglodytarum]
MKPQTVARVVSALLYEKRTPTEVQERTLNGRIDQALESQKDSVQGEHVGTEMQVFQPRIKGKTS